MGNELIRALSRPIESAIHDCAQISSESDCQSVRCTCHSRTIAPDADDSEIEISIQSKEKG